MLCHHISKRHTVFNYNKDCLLDLLYFLIFYLYLFILHWYCQWRVSRWAKCQVTLCADGVHHIQPTVREFKQHSTLCWRINSNTVKSFLSSEYSQMSFSFQVCINFFFLLLLPLLFSLEGVASGWLVKTIPGFPGELPFKLETG